MGLCAEVRPVVTVISGACVASAEVYNNETKTTRAPGVCLSLFCRDRRYGSVSIAN